MSPEEIHESCRELLRKAENSLEEDRAINRESKIILDKAEELMNHSKKLSFGSFMVGFIAGSVFALIVAWAMWK